MRTTQFRLLCAAWLATALLTGCGGEEKAAAPQLSEYNCFGLFTRADLAPLMGNGETVKEASPIDIRLSAVRRAATCNIDVDGESRVRFMATRQSLGQSFFWHTDRNQPPPDPLPLGDKGIVWDTGARVALTCDGPSDAFELELGISGSVEHMEPGTSRALFARLMAKYLAAAREQTRCGQ
ncbi:hypothetical protein [Streptomyces sp. NPDC017949]|uniref:hypothetical protein n=1 Tax=Streptomyces sp. NPDC017949 TaxID=3365020 RepID=UPI003798F622